MTEQKKIDGRTKRALDLAIARRQVSQESYHAVMEGRITLAEAKSFGRDRGPDTPEGQSGPGEGSRGPRKRREPRLCLCSCGQMTRGGRFLPGHDASLFGKLKRNLEKDPLLKNEKFIDEQRRYAVERGLAGPEVLPQEERDG